MSAYRDAFERCPRCGTELVDARSMRGCKSCGGLWVEEPILSEMVLRMLPPGALNRLELAVLARSDEQPLACPVCGDVMQQTQIHGVPIDRCGKQHGVWFDAKELETALHRVAEHGAVPPPEPERPTRTTLPPVAPPATVELAFRIDAPGQAPEVRVIRHRIIKLGKAPTSTLVLADDGLVSRMHAIIEAESAQVITIIDLGSTAGTIVNGDQVNKTRLHLGDVIKLGSTILTLEAITNVE